MRFHNICMAFLCATLVAGCSSSVEKSDDLSSNAAVNTAVKVPEKTARALDIQTEEVARHELKVARPLAGKVEPDVGKEVDISSRVSGRVDQLLVSPGENVEQGQALAYLTSREVSDLEAQAIEISARLDTAKAQANRERVVYQSQVRIPKGLIDARAADKEAQTALHLAKSKLERQRILVNEKIGAEKDLIAAQAAYEQALSDAEQAKANSRREQEFFTNKALLKAPLMKAEAELKQAEKQLQALESQLKFLGVDTSTLQANMKNGSFSGRIRLTAPIAGQLSFFDIAAGELIAADKPLFRVTDLSTVLISADVPESDVMYARPGMSLHISVPGIPKHQVAPISIVASHLDQATRTLPVRARIANKSHLFKPGMFASVHIVEENREALAIPKTAVQEVHGHKVVFVKDGSGYEERQISLASEDDNYVEVKSGLSAGERVVTQGSLMLKTQLSYASGAKHD